MQVVSKTSCPFCGLCLQKVQLFLLQRWCWQDFISFFYLFSSFFNWKSLPASPEDKDKAVKDFSRWKAGSLATAFIDEKWDEQHHLHRAWGHLWNTLSTIKPRPSSSTAVGRPLDDRSSYQKPDFCVTRLNPGVEKILDLSPGNAEKRITLWKSCCCDKVPWRQQGCMGGFGCWKSNITEVLFYLLTGWENFETVLITAFCWMRILQSCSQWAARAFLGFLSHCCAAL